MMRFITLLFSFLFSIAATTKLMAQIPIRAVGAADKIDGEARDTLITEKKIFQPDAKRAGLYAALLPGMGQLYNRQYWKMPIVYALMGTTIYMAVTKNSEYRRYRKAYISRLSNGQNSSDEFQGILSDASIKTYQDAAKQNADMMVVLTVIVYSGQILEAISGAHLKNFDISKDLSLHISPIITPINTLGMGLVFQFKK